MLLVMILVLLFGGIAAGFSGRVNAVAPRWIALIATSINLVISLWIWSRPNDTTSPWLQQLRFDWIPSFGISFHLALDGVSLLMIILTFFLGIVAVLISWNEIQFRVGFFHFNLLWVLAGITGVFLTMDLFLFYFFWEVMLIPMYFLIGIWGHENKQYAAYKFFIFTQASGLLMLMSIIALYFIHGQATDQYTFDYFVLLGTKIEPHTAQWIMLGFLAAFVVKLPVVPFHTWLPDAHTEAPTAGSLILAGLLLKTGAYGLIRFVLPLFPQQSAAIAPLAMTLGVIGIIYGAIQAYGQTDLKRLIAYTSVSHMGFVMLGVFAFTEIALQGVVMQMITHGISTGALFIIAGLLYERVHTRDITQMGGFWKMIPFTGVIAMIFVMASLGLPGLGNFIAEFLTLIGTWSSNKLMTIFATIGIVFATAYSLRIMQKVFVGGTQLQQRALSDLSMREKIVLIPMALLIILLGVYPQPTIDVAKAALKNTLQNEFTIPIKAKPLDPNLQTSTHPVSQKGENHE